MVTPARITLARRRRALTLAGLSARVKVSVQSLSNYETGRTAPRPATLTRLAEVLDFPESFFHGPPLPEVPAESVSWRDFDRTHARAREAARVSALLGAEVYDWIGRRFRLPPVDLPPAVGVDPLVAAGELRDAWGLGTGPVPDMVRLLESRGVRVFALAAEHARVGTFSVWHRGFPYLFLNTAKAPAHARLDAAHELGHLLLHRDGRPCTGPLADRDADAFAAAFLMPDVDMPGAEAAPASTACAQAQEQALPLPRGPRLADVVAAARTWGVPPEAVATRMLGLGLLDDTHHRRLCRELALHEARPAAPGGRSPLPSPALPAARITHALRAAGVRPAAVAAEVGISVNELNWLLGMIPAPGRQQPGTAAPRTTERRPHR
ncbi:XRE family transcriptional regulator [Streptomyces sp. NPDC052114]|uniref:XRE family transcriptional regulator n=1 Tax=unclassified Streptomyces TaxID=2593676 RepID=UPI00343F5C68